jgi:two-component system phosphate regulon sensor histidine kinase PhoR
MGGPPRKEAAFRAWLGMRLLLGISFALIAALTAVAVVRVLSDRSEEAFRNSAEEFAVGSSVAAAERLNEARSPVELRAAAVSIAQRRRLSLFLFDRSGALVFTASPTALRFEQVPGGAQALAGALDRRRYIGGSSDGTITVVGLQMRGPGVAALVALSPRPELREQLGIVRDEVGEAALLATLLGAAAGLIVATLFARRLTRIARTARAIESGDFSTPVRDRVPDEIGSLATSIDRMRLRLAELIRALQEDRDRFERLLGRLHEGVLLLDRDLTIVFANARAAELVSSGRASAGLKLTDAWPDGRVLRLAADLFGSTPPLPLHLEVGEQMLLVSGIPSAAGDNAVLVVADTTERERSERAQRAFVTNAAHELRTPLAGIVTAVEMLQTGAKDDPEARDEFLALIERESSRLTRLTRALLVLARAEAHQEPLPVSDVPLAPLVARVLENVDAGGDVQLEAACDPDLTVRTHPDLLEQALSSLVANAEKYTTEGRIAVRCRTDNGRLRIEVEDTGPGIPEEEQDRVLERFYRGAGDTSEGFGLGLAIAARATEALGGTIGVRSAAGSGTTIHLTLPQGGGDR